MAMRLFREDVGCKQLEELRFDDVAAATGLAELFSARSTEADADEMPGHDPTRPSDAAAPDEAIDPETPADAGAARDAPRIAGDSFADGPGATEGDAPATAGVNGPSEPDAADGAALPDAEAQAEADGAEAAVNLPALEALLLSTHHPLTAPRLAELLGLASVRPLRRAIHDLNEQYASGGRSFRVEQVAGGFQILTLPEHGELLKKLHQKEVDAKLTKAALETLSIIAYKQPVLRADVEAIRGVACGETIRSLMEKHLVKIAGRAEEPGRPILYGTTKRFLELFGLNSLKDLPQPDAAERRK